MLRGPVQSTAVESIQRPSTTPHRMHPTRSTPQDAGTAADAARTSDSGYSSSPHTRPHPVARESLAPVPVVWTNADESREGTPTPAWKRTKELGRGAPGAGGEDRGADVRRSQSMRSYRAGRADRYEGSPHAASLGRRTPRRRVSLSSGSFANGPGMVGPNASMEGEEADVFRTRSILADAGLSKKQKQQIAKEECEWHMFLSVSWGSVGC